MSNQWEGGKGDRNRTENLKAWRDNYDKIFGQKKVVNVAPSGTLPEWKTMDQKWTAVEDSDGSFSFKLSYDATPAETKLEECLDFLKNIDLEEYPVQAAKELYKKLSPKGEGQKIP